MNNRFDEDFIKRATEIAKPEVDRLIEKQRKRIEKWNKENPEKLKKCQKEYMKTEKGKISNRRRTAIYNKRIRELAKLLDKQEKEAIRMFYVNCPPGYEVDHIIPLSKGGKHHITNLQYLEWRENRRKKNKLDWKNYE